MLAASLEAWGTKHFGFEYRTPIMSDDVVSLLSGVAAWAVPLWTSARRRGCPVIGYEASDAHRDRARGLGAATSWTRRTYN